VALGLNGTPANPLLGFMSVWVIQAHPKPMLSILFMRSSFDNALLNQLSFTIHEL
jgi:hypothetical protein